MPNSCYLLSKVTATGTTGCLQQHGVFGPALRVSPPSVTPIAGLCNRIPELPAKVNASGVFMPSATMQMAELDKLLDESEMETINFAWESLGSPEPMQPMQL